MINKKFTYMDGKFSTLSAQFKIDETNHFPNDFGFSSVHPCAINDFNEITGNGKIWDIYHPFIAIPSS